MQRAIQTAVVVLVSWCLVACTTLQSLPVNAGSQQPPPSLAAGDEVTLVLNSGEQVALKVQSADATAVQGKVSASGADRSVAWADVQRVEQRKADALKSTLLVVAIVLVGAVLAAKALAKDVANSLGAAGG